MDVPPEPQRAIVRWTEKSFGFHRNYDRSGWVILLDNQKVVGPADVLLPSAQPIGDVILEVAGLQLKLDLKQIEQSGTVAVAPVSATVPEGIALWPHQRRRVASEPEDVLVVGDPQTPPVPVAAIHLVANGNAWNVDSSARLTPAWHGAPVVSSKDGALVGVVIYRRGTPQIVPFDR